MYTEPKDKAQVCPSGCSSWTGRGVEAGVGGKSERWAVRLSRIQVEMNYHIRLPVWYLITQLK